MNESLTLNDGTVLENARAVESSDLFLYINGLGMAGVFALLIDPETTERIIYTMVNGSEITYNNYQHLIAVRDEGNGLITAVLRKGMA